MDRKVGKGERDTYLRLGCEFGSGWSEMVGHRHGCRELILMRNVLYKPIEISSYQKQACSSVRFCLSFEGGAAGIIDFRSWFAKSLSHRFGTKHQQSFEIKIANQICVENQTSGDESGPFCRIRNLEP